MTQDGERLALAVCTANNDRLLVIRNHEDYAAADFEGIVRDAVGNQGFYEVANELPLFSDTVKCASFRAPTGEKTWVAVLHSDEDLDEVLQDETIVQFGQQAKSAEVLSLYAEGFGRLVKALQFAQNTQSLKIGVEDLWPSGYHYLNARLQLPNLRSLMVRYDRGSKQRLAGHQQLADLFEPMHLSELLLVNVPPTAVSLHSLCSSSLSALRLCGFTEAEMHCLLHMLAAKGAQPRLLSLNDVHVPAELPHSALAGLLSVEILNVTSNSIRRLLSLCPKSVGSINLVNPVMPWFPSATLLDTLAVSCPRLDYLSIYQWPWFTYARFQYLAAVWGTQKRTRMKRFQFDEACGLDLSCFSDTFKLDSIESNLAEAVTVVPSYENTRPIHELVRGGGVSIGEKRAFHRAFG